MQCCRNLANNGHRLADIQFSAPQDQLLQILTIDVFLSDKVDAIDAPDFVDLVDVRVYERSRGLSLIVKPFHKGFVFGQGTL